MKEFKDALGSILSKAAERLGIKPSEAGRYGLMKEKLIAARAGNADQIESLKDKIRRLQARAVQKKREYDEARGDIKRILAGEIERTLRELDRLQGQEKIIASNMERISVALEKVEELEAAQTQGVEEGAIDDLAIGLQEAFDRLKSEDQAIKDLQREKYEPPEREAMDIEDRVAEIQGTKERASELSQKSQERLKELEAEKE